MLLVALLAMAILGALIVLIALLASDKNKTATTLAPTVSPSPAPTLAPVPEGLEGPAALLATAVPVMGTQMVTQMVTQAATRPALDPIAEDDEFDEDLP